MFSDHLVGEVVVIEDSNIQMNVDVEQAITDDTFITEKNCILERMKKVDTTSQFFIVIRRGSNLSRILNLWQRASKRTIPDKT